VPCENKNNAYMKQVAAYTHAVVIEYLAGVGFPAVLITVKPYPADDQTDCQRKIGVKAK
jgi:hypothetical protein